MYVLSFAIGPEYFLCFVLFANCVSSQSTCRAGNISPLRQEQDPRSLSVRSHSLSQSLYARTSRFILFTGHVSLFMFARCFVAARRRAPSSGRDRRSRSVCSGQKLRARSLMRTASGHVMLTRVARVAELECSAVCLLCLNLNSFTHQPSRAKMTDFFA